MSIPKIIHYCWFGGKPKPKLAEKCIRSWKKYCPDYEIIEWNENNFDVAAAPLYVRQAYETGRWAFVTDYVRLKAMVEMGGIYMDTDVEVIKPLDPYLKHKGFAGFEHPQRIQTGLLACEKGFPLFQEFIAYYDTAAFFRNDGSQNTTTNVQVLTRLCEKYGLRLDGSRQTVQDFEVYPTEYFCPVDFDTEKLCKSKNTVVIHWFAASWHTEVERRYFEDEKKRKKRERRSQFRHGIGTKLFGEAGYAKLKSLLKR